MPKDHAVSVPADSPPPCRPVQRASSAVLEYAAAESSASAMPAGRTELDWLPRTSTASPASAPQTASAPIRPIRSPSSSRPASAVNTGPAPRVTMVATASPVSRTAAKYPAWKTAMPAPAPPSSSARVQREGAVVGRAAGAPVRRSACAVSRIASAPTSRQKEMAVGPRSLER